LPSVPWFQRAFLPDFSHSIILHTPEIFIEPCQHVDRHVDDSFCSDLWQTIPMQRLAKFLVCAPHVFCELPTSKDTFKEGNTLVGMSLCQSKHRPENHPGDQRCLETSLRDFAGGRERKNNCSFPSATIENPIKLGKQG
jgi:hypothetical protein